MEKSRKASWFVLLGMVAAPSVARAQVPEKIPSYPIDPNWAYTSPGPAKCVEVGNFYLRKGKLVAALSRFQEALKAQPHYAAAYLGLGRVYERMNLRQKALDAYQRYLDELPSARDAADAKDVQKAVARLRSQLRPARQSGKH